jgi:hypothetical protein
MSAQGGVGFSPGGGGAGGGGNITGTGTVNTICKFTAATVIGDSSLTNPAGGNLILFSGVNAVLEWGTATAPFSVAGTVGPDITIQTRDGNGGANDGGSLIIQTGKPAGAGVHGTFQCPGNGAKSVVIGYQAVGDTDYTIAIGSNAAALLTKNIAIGYGTLANNNLSLAVGNAASAVGANSIAIGSNAANNETSAISIGPSATVLAGGSLGVAIGSGASVAGVGSIAIGGGATISAGANSSIAIGQNTSVVHTNCVALGYTSTSTANNQFICGNALNHITDIYFGSGVVDSTASTYTIHGTGGLGSDNAGADLNLIGGLSTGTAGGGSVVIQTNSPAAGTSAVPNAPVTRVTISATDMTLNLCGLTMPQSTQNGGGVGTTYNVKETDFTIFADTTAAAFTVHLPSAVTHAGKMYNIKLVAGGGINPLTIDAVAGNIDGSGSMSITVVYTAIMVQSNGTNWMIL